jgi:hypothetical protein
MRLVGANVHHPCVKVDQVRDTSWDLKWGLASPIVVETARNDFGGAFAPVVRGQVK